MRIIKCDHVERLTKRMLAIEGGEQQLSIADDDVEYAFEFSIGYIYVPPDHNIDELMAKLSLVADFSIHKHKLGRQSSGKFNWIIRTMDFIVEDSGLCEKVVSMVLDYDDVCVPPDGSVVLDFGWTAFRQMSNIEVVNGPATEIVLSANANPLAYIRKELPRWRRVGNAPESRILDRTLSQRVSCGSCGHNITTVAFLKRKCSNHYWCTYCARSSTFCFYVVRVEDDQAKPSRKSQFEAMLEPEIDKGVQPIDDVTVVDMYTIGDKFLLVDSLARYLCSPEAYNHACSRDRKIFIGYVMV